MSNQIMPYEDQIVRELAQPTVAQSLHGALPPWLNVAQFTAQAAIMAANPPKDRDKNPPSILAMTSALLNAAQMGLMPGPSRHVAFVNRKGVLLAQPQWQGLQFLFGLGGWVVSSHVVHESDVFEYEAIGPDEFAVTKHSYDPFTERKFAFPGTGLRGVYVKGVNQTTGEVRYRMINRERINRAIGATSTSSSDTPWHTDFALMCVKTGFQQAAARRWFDMPAEVMARLALAVERDYEAAEQTPHPALSVPSKVAANIARLAAPQPASAPQEALPAPAPVVHSPPVVDAPSVRLWGWVNDEDRKAFCAELSRGGVDYNNVARWCNSIGRERPSAMSFGQRNHLLEYLHTDAGMAKYRAFLLSSEPAPVPTPAPPSESDDVGFFDEPSPAVQEVPL